MPNDTTINNYPLAWPPHIRRWPNARATGSFQTSLTKALDNVTRSLKLFASDSSVPVTNIIISSNYTLGDHSPDDSGVAVWFTWDGNQVCIPVDRYAKIEANLQAIHHIIEARRVELRHGTLALVRASFAGFKSLPPPAPEDHWTRVLGLPASKRPTTAEIAVAYRDRAKAAHPDSGGSQNAMARLNAARDAALAEAIKS